TKFSRMKALMIKDTTILVACSLSLLACAGDGSFTPDDAAATVSPSGTTPGGSNPMSSAAVGPTSGAPSSPVSPNAVSPNAVSPTTPGTTPGVGVEPTTSSDPTGVSPTDETEPTGSTTDMTSD